MKKITLLLFLLTVSIGFAQAPTVDPTTPPARDTADYISIFSDTYTNITGANYNPNWGQSGFGTADTAYMPTGAGNVVLAYPNFNYQGVEYGGTYDVSAMEFLHVDIWTDAGVAPNIYVISSGAEIAHAIPNASGSWQSIDIPIAGITGDPTSAIQFKFDGGNGTTHAIYVDNLYFWKNPAAAGTDATLSDLQLDNVTIAGFSPNTETYTVDLPAGTTVAPTVSATTTDPIATITTLTQAPSVPGDATVLVTAADGTTTKTYTVSFTLTTPGTDAPTPPARDANDVISIFSEAYANVPNVDYNPNWGQSGFGSADTANEIVTGSGNLSLEYPNFNYQGNDFNGAQDISAMEFLHVDVWTNDQSPNVYVISSGAEIPHALGNQPGSWISIDIPIAGITGDLTSAIQFKFDGGTGGKIYLDNLYFWKTPTAAGTDATLSDLQLDNVTLAGFTPNTEMYAVDLPGGTTVAPTVSATTTDPLATITTLTQAPGVPGDATVLVTAADGTTTKTYTVSFAVTTPGADAPTPPARDPADVISIFSDAYANVPNVDYNPNWGQSGFGSANTANEIVPASGNLSLEYPNFNYQGNDFNGAQDISTMEFLHLDIWTNDQAPNVYVISSGAETPHAIPTMAGSWQSIEIPITGITGDLTSAIQFKFDGGTGGKIYLDNLYFYKGQPLSTDEFEASNFKVYPNPTNTIWNVRSTQNIDTIQVFDVLGKQVITLTPNSDTALIDASGLNNGLYFARLSSAIGTKTVKLIKR